MNDLFLIVHWEHSFGWIENNTKQFTSKTEQVEVIIGWIENYTERFSSITEQLGLHWLDIQSNLHKCDLNNTERNLNNTECFISWIQDTRGYRTVRESFERTIQINLKPPPSAGYKCLMETLIGTSFFQ